jgi:hypothetical protein
VKRHGFFPIFSATSDFSDPSLPPGQSLFGGIQERQVEFSQRWKVPWFTGRRAQRIRFFWCFGLPLFGGEQPKKNKMLFAPETQEFSICQKHPLK